MHGALRALRLRGCSLCPDAYADRQSCSDWGWTITDSGWSIASIFPIKGCGPGYGTKPRDFWSALALAAIVVELLYFIIRQFPQYWWLIAWAAFLGLFVLMAQLAPVVLFPIFYKFEPLDNAELSPAWWG